MTDTITTRDNFYDPLRENVAIKGFDFSFTGFVLGGDGYIGSNPEIIEKHSRLDRFSFDLAIHYNDRDTRHSTCDLTRKRLESAAHDLLRYQQVYGNDIGLDGSAVIGHWTMTPEEKATIVKTVHGQLEYILNADRNTLELHHIRGTFDVRHDFFAPNKPAPLPTHKPAHVYQSPIF